MGIGITIPIVLMSRGRAAAGVRAKWIRLDLRIHLYDIYLVDIKDDSGLGIL